MASHPASSPPERERVAGGSGFIISKNGYIVTNNHVIEGASDIEIRLADGATRAAQLIGTGGPLFNTSGQVIGVNIAIFSPGGGNVGIGFAVPSSIAQDVVRQLVDTGEVERGFIGVSLQSITEVIARALGLEGTEGAIVTGVEPGAPAAAAGIQEGDVILSIDGVNVEDPREISRAVADIAPGSEVPVTVFRDGERIEVTLTLARRDRAPEASEVAPAEGEMMGLSVSPLPELVRRNLGLEEGQALYVQNVQRGSPAAEAGIMQGDVIRSAAGEDLVSALELSSAWSRAREAGSPLLLRINRDGNTLFIAAEVQSDGPRE